MKVGHDLPFNHVGLIKRADMNIIYGTEAMENTEYVSTFPVDSVNLLRVSPFSEIFDSGLVTHLLKEYPNFFNYIELPFLRYQDETTLDLILEAIQSLYDLNFFSEFKGIGLTITPSANDIYSFGYCLNEAFNLINQVESYNEIVINLDFIYQNLAGGLDNIILLYLYHLRNKIIIRDVQNLSVLDRLNHKFNLFGATTNLAFKNGYTQNSLMEYPNIVYYPGELNNYHLTKTTDEIKLSLVIENVEVINAIANKEI